MNKRKAMKIFSSLICMLLFTSFQLTAEILDRFTFRNIEIKRHFRRIQYHSGIQETTDYLQSLDEETKKMLYEAMQTTLDKDENTVFHLMIDKVSVDKFLLLKPDVNKTNKVGITPLIMFLINNNISFGFFK